jgi:hypothetical protein
MTTYLGVLNIKKLVFAIRTALVIIVGCARQVEEIPAERPFCEAVSRRVNSPAKLALLFHRIYGGSSA